MLRLQQLTSSRENRVACKSNEIRGLLDYSIKDNHRVTRLAVSETEQERAARLQQMSASQQDRITNETEQERAARLPHDIGMLSNIE